MTTEIIFSIIIPFIGTILGSCCIYLFKRLDDKIVRAFSGFAGGVMFAASIWSLIIPSFEQASNMENLSFIPVVVGLWAGFLFLMLLDKLVPHTHCNEDEPEGLKCKLKRSTMTSLAVALHNFPEGLAVGVVLASATNESSSVPITMAIALAIGIAVQNFPEGAIVSVSMNASGTNKHKSCLLGILSGIVEPIGALITFFLASFITPALPYLLCFAAGAMIYVTIEELIPEMVKGKHSHIGTILFAIGFTLMMILDVLLG